MREKRFEPKVGDKVSVCYDGKRGRDTDGVVFKRRGFVVQVEFIPWAGNGKKKHRNWFVRTYPTAFGGYLRGEDSLMRLLVGTPGDWYSVYPHKTGWQE